LPKTKHEDAGASRSLWSGTISFGLVSIPVDLFAAVRRRKTAMKMVDPKGRALGRQYYCPKDEQTLRSTDIVRGFETDKGKMLVMTDEELESVAPEMTRDIEIRRFVPIEQIPPSYFQRPYFLAPAGRSTKAYHLLAGTMESTRRAGIGSFVMRGHEYLAALLSNGGLLRMATLRHADELRSASDVGLPKTKKAPTKEAQAFAKAIDALTRDKLDVDELSDRYAAAVSKLVQTKEKKGKDIVKTSGAESADGEPATADVLDLMKALRERLSSKATVTTADDTAPVRQKTDNVHKLPTRGSRARATPLSAKRKHSR
jgi:DNA end-binding protein Ku